MFKRIVFLTIISALSFGLFAKSTLKAVLLSAALPGTGQYYLEHSTKAGIFWSTEALAWFTFLRLNHENSIAEDDYQMYAKENAGIPLGSPDEIYQTAQNWMSDDIYNLQIEKEARNYFQYYTYKPEEYDEWLNTYRKDYDWQWKDEKSIRKYQDLRDRKQNLEAFSKFSMASFFLNRIVSVVDAAITSKKMKKSNYGKLFMTPTIDEPGVKLVYEYKF